MTVSQVGRTTDSVTINVSGITKGDRQTSVWIPKLISGATSNWFTLQEAQGLGYISGIGVADYSTNNGDITVSVPGNYYSKLKCVGLNVKNGENIGTDKEVIYSSIDIYTILDFEYESKIFPKCPGDDIDITVRDLQEINYFGIDIDEWFNDGEGYWYDLSTVSTGDYIYADYLRLPAQNILNAVRRYNSFMGTNYNEASRHLFNIVDNCVSGADFEAQFFNDIVEAIRNFNLSYTK